MEERLNECIELYKEMSLRDDVEDIVIHRHLGNLRELYYIKDGTIANYISFAKIIYAKRGWECPYE